MIPLFKPHMPKLPELDSILESGNLAFGKYGHKFERKLSDYIGNDKVLVTNSYNMAILVALGALGIENGDEVLLSPLACLASTQPLIAAGLKVRWVDVDPKTGTLSPKSLREKITKKSKLIIHNHYCGNIGYVDEINEIGKEFSIPVIDDCIEAFGGEYKGKKMGNLGTDVTIFSFNAVRIPNTIDGGAVVYKDKELYDTSILIRDCGIDRKIFRDENGEISANCDITMIGHSATMSDVNAYIGIRQLEKIEEILKKQRENGVYWSKYLDTNFKGVEPIYRDEVNPNYWVYGFLTDSKNKLLHYLRKKGFYASSVHLSNNHYSIFGSESELQGVEAFNKMFLAVPSGWWFDFKNSSQFKEKKK